MLICNAYIIVALEMLLDLFLEFIISTVKIRFWGSLKEKKKGVFFVKLTFVNMLLFPPVVRWLIIV